MVLDPVADPGSTQPTSREPLWPVRTTVLRLQGDQVPGAAQQIAPRADGFGGKRRNAGFPLYPHHLTGGSACGLDEVCTAIARTAEAIGVGHSGIGSDLCQDQPESVVEWMRVGRWTKSPDCGEGSATAAGGVQRR